MLILLTVIFIALIIIGCIIDDYDFTPFGIAVGCIGFVIVLIAMIIVGIELSSMSVIDEKLKMYTEENTKIETQISDTVNKYMEYEKDTFIELKNESAITLVSLYPELKSDELIKTQILTYQENNSKIKSLKEKQINESVYRWWLYFGK